ncbi:DUF2842 domain-containing protein [Sinirhodobacter sp. HNIBRBA609]|nr:DUF2842 domain-containing protein [Sinirhodobacter sp. HNIBRBA609]
MALSYKARRRLSILVLVVGLPLYIVVTVTLTGWLNERFGRLPIWAELLVYIGLGFLWMLPLKPVFSGVGREDPDAKK